jgi:hypothetical protein
MKRREVQSPALASLGSPQRIAKALVQPHLDKLAVWRQCILPSIGLPVCAIALHAHAPRGGILVSTFMGAVHYAVRHMLPCDDLLKAYPGSVAATVST